MSVYISLSPWEFEDLFAKMGRDYYSSDGYRALYDILDEQNAEVDVVAICGEWAEYDDFEHLNSDYGYLVDGEPFDDAELLGEAILDEIGERTNIVKLANGGWLIQSF